MIKLQFAFTSLFNVTFFFFKWHTHSWLSPHFSWGQQKKMRRGGLCRRASLISSLVPDVHALVSIKTWGRGQESHEGSPATLLTPWMTQPSPQALWCHTTHTHWGLEWQRCMWSSWGMFTGNTQETANLSSFITWFGWFDWQIHGCVASSVTK